MIVPEVFQRSMPKPKNKKQKKRYKTREVIPLKNIYKSLRQ